MRKIYSFASLSDLVNVAINGKSEMASTSRSSRVPSEGRAWSGGSWEDASRLAVNGDIEGARRLAPAVLKAVNALVANHPRLDPVYRLDEGRWIDVARYVKGEPECWGDMVEGERAPRKGAAVIVNVAASAAVSAPSLDRIGVAIGSAILGLQTQGYAVTLYAAEKIHPSYGRGGSNDVCLTYAPVNPGGSPLDVSRLSVILRPWFLRRIMFSFDETLPHDVREFFGIPGGYGRVAPLDIKDAELISGQKDAVIIDVNSAVYNPDAITDRILKAKGA